MPANSDSPVPATGIRFANGQQWRFRPTDKESEAVVRRLAEIMHLSEITSGREIFVTVRDAPRLERTRVPGRDPLTCILPAGTGEIMKIIQMTDLATAVSIETLPAGGVLIHGALAERDGQGVIFAAPGGTGKSTASRRIPPPWRSLSDDATLVVPDRDGRYIAHPWPTWSRFQIPDAPGGSWEVEHGVPLTAIFFLSQSPEDRIEPLDTNEMCAFLMESVHQAVGAIARVEYTRKESEFVYNLEIAAVSGIADRIPAYLLHISLTGRFWDVIAPVLDRNAAVVQSATLSPRRPSAAQGITPPPTMFGAGHIPIVYTGPSMNPTLETPDLLEIELCGERAPETGDVICFRSTEKDRNIVHRVIGSSGAGLITRGDNNPTPDPDPVTPDMLIGKVVAAWRQNSHRPIHGGRRGQLTHAWLRARKTVRMKTMWLIRLGRPLLYLTRAFSKVLPERYRPRIVLYSSLSKNILRLHFGQSVAGEYSELRGWKLRYPFRLMVDEDALPTIQHPRKDRKCSGPPANISG